MVLCSAFAVSSLYYDSYVYNTASDYNYADIFGAMTCVLDKYVTSVKPPPQNPMNTLVIQVTMSIFLSMKVKSW